MNGDTPNSLLECQIGEFRLYNEQTSENGAVTGIPQVCLAGVWSSVCNIAQPLNLSQVLCKDLGFEGKV